MDTVQTNPAAAVSRRFISLLETLICKKKNVFSRHSLNSVQSENKKKKPTGASRELLSSFGNVCVDEANVHEWEHGAHGNENPAAQTQLIVLLLFLPLRVLVLWLDGLSDFSGI